MTIENKPIHRDPELYKVLTCLPEKFVVDLANGIDATQDHLRVQRRRSNKTFARLLDEFTGAGAKRQTSINASLADGVEGSLRWLMELSGELARSNLAIATVNDRVSSLTKQTSKIAIYSEETREILQRFSAEASERIAVAEQAILRVEFKQDVRRNIDGVFAKWEAGRFGRLSPAGRCYAVLEELRWGHFGDYIRSDGSEDKGHFIQLVIDRSVKCMAADLNIAPRQRINTAAWLALPPRANRNDDWNQALAYMAGDYKITAAPFVSIATGLLDEWHDDVPRITKPERIAEAIFEETFQRGRHV